jgi:hypothetical protein
MVRISNDVAELQLKKKFDKLTFGSKSDSDWNVCVEHFGEVNTSTITTISNSLEARLSNYHFSKSTNKKAFAILIEGLQNIYRHGLQNEMGEVIGAFVFLCNETTVQLHFFNLIHADSIDRMNEFCQKLNSMSMEKIKQLYLETLSHADMTDKGGASLGCLLMKLKSDGNLSYSIENIDNDISSFHLVVSVNN